MVDRCACARRARRRRLLPVPARGAALGQPIRAGGRPSRPGAGCPGGTASGPAAAAAVAVAAAGPQRPVGLSRQLQPLCEDAWRELGRPGRFDDALAKAIHVLLATPIVDSDVELRPKVISYAFADPRLEELSEAQKHFLRMGPRNVRLIQGQVRALAAALGVPGTAPLR